MFFDISGNLRQILTHKFAIFDKIWRITLRTGPLAFGYASARSNR